MRQVAGILALCGGVGTALSLLAHPTLAAAGLDPTVTAAASGALLAIGAAALAAQAPPPDGRLFPTALVLTATIPALLALAFGVAGVPAFAEPRQAAAVSLLLVPALGFPLGVAATRRQQAVAGVVLTAAAAPLLVAYHETVWSLPHLAAEYRYLVPVSWLLASLGIAVLALPIALGRRVRFEQSGTRPPLAPLCWATVVGTAVLTVSLTALGLLHPTVRGTATYPGAVIAQILLVGVLAIGCRRWRPDD